MRLFLFILLLVGAPISNLAQFVAFNDHAPGGGTAPNTTSWNVLGNPPGASGPLRNIATGANLPVTLNITRSPGGVVGAGAQGQPAPGSPLHSVFNGWVDFQGSPNPSVELSGDGAVIYSFRGLDPSKLYSFRGGAVRGNAAYTDRWTLFEIVGAQSFTAAHTANALTTAQVSSISPAQAAINTGANHTAATGDMAAWDDINPGANGQFAVVCRHYTGPVPGGSSGGGKGYSMTGLRLEEYNATPEPVTITRQPESLAVDELRPATFTVGFAGNPRPTFQWQKNDVPIPGATQDSYTMEAARLSDDGARFKVVVTHRINNADQSLTSDEALLRVLPDTSPLLLLSAQAISPTQVKLIFSKPVSPLTATNTAHYSITSEAGALPISSAMFDLSAATVLLVVSPKTEGAVYTIIVDGLRDQTAAGNLIAANSQATFNAVAYPSEAVGDPSLAGSIAAVPGGYDLTGSGADVGGVRDQFQFGYQERTGNFDFRVRLADLTVTDAYVKAGLMVRENLENNARFAAIFASSAQLGCFFQSRTTLGGNATLMGPSTKFPANYPWAWLRLRRNGNEFTGYGGFDGKTWQQLGTANLALPQRVLFGMTVTSGATDAVATARFREIGPIEDPAEFQYRPHREPIGPSNRRTGLIFSEIMYRPKTRPDEKNLAFIEIYNGGTIFADLTGWRIAGGIDFAFPRGFNLQAGEFAVIAADPQAIESVYGIQGVLGPYQGQLSGRATLTLLNQSGALRAELTYSPEFPWPASADGAGHSLVCLRPSYGEEDPRAWAASQLISGSPGFDDPIVPHPWAGVVINEFLAAPGEEPAQFIELYNAGNKEVDLSGCFLTDSFRTNKFRIPDGVRLEARGWISFTQEQFGFGMNRSGETIYLVAPDEARVLDAIRFGAQEQGVSSGRSPDGGPVVRRLLEPTPGEGNAPWLRAEVVINELMYKPITGDDDDQYAELYNRSAVAVDLSGWRFIDGINFTIPSGTSIPAGGYLVVARNLPRILANHPHLTPRNTVGNFSGRLSGSGERVALAKPSSRQGDFITVSEVTYVKGGRWPELAHGGGSSLELIDPHADPLLSSNWAASDETKKSSWESFEATETMNHANQNHPANKAFIVALGDGGEYLLDDLEIFRADGANLVMNPGFENGPAGWNFYGTHLTSNIRNTGAFSGNHCLHIRADQAGDTAPNSVRGNLTATIPGNSIVTIRAQARWLSGWPEILVRVRGNGVELPITFNVPSNLGTPGLPNSRRTPNAGPSISEVSHYPPTPAANQSVLVTARISDPDGVAAPQLIYRVDPGNTSIAVMMRDDGIGGDLLAGDGIYSATLPARSSGLAAFRIEARDQAATPALSVFPGGEPQRECLIRWADPAPFGSIPNYHLWSTVANSTSVPGLDRKYRDCTVVYQNRVIYNAGWRNKGSPYHSGTGSYSARFGADDLLLGSARNLFASTGNGGHEGTAMADDVAYWIASRMDVPYNHSHYMRLYRNGALHYPVSYNMEVPSKSIAKDWFGGGGVNDTLYKIAIWFEFNDSNGGGTSSTLGSTFQRKPGNAPPYKLAAYRFNWEIHPDSPSANDYSSLFNLITAANASDRVTQLMTLADMEQWMRVFAWERVVGNWDSWSYRVGQNMYLYAPLGRRATLIPWDVDFVLGLGDGATMNQLFTAGQDPVVQALFNVPAYRRMLWRAYQDAANGPLQPENSNPQLDSRRAMLLKNNVNPTAPNAIRSYISSRRNYLQNQINNADTAAFSVSTQDFTSSSATATLTGTAPFAVATIEVNGIPYPVTWTSQTAWRIQVPLEAASNSLQITGKDPRGNVPDGATAQVTIEFTGVTPQPEDWVVIHELMHSPARIGAEYVELYNRHSTFAFDLSTFRLSGAGFIFAPGTFIQPNSYLVVAADPAAFADAYGETIPLAGQFPGKLQRGGEVLRLIKPGATREEDKVISELAYENVPPWPVIATDSGVSLQLIDPARDIRRAGNWTASTSAPFRTPGAPNSVAALLPEFPQLWINEVQPENLDGIRDETGQSPPWIEIYNAGSGIVPLDGLHLANQYTNLTQWAFPEGAQIAPGAFKLIFADGPARLSTPSELRANFRLQARSGSVALSRLHNGRPRVLDHVNYANVPANRSYGSFPDGQPVARIEFFFATPGAGNDGAPPDPRVFINEWMAGNQAFLAGPAGRFDDWFELYNAGANAVDLTGYYLTDKLDEPARFKIPPGYPIPPNGFLLFWANGESERNDPSHPDLHVNFKLSKEGESIGLFTPGGHLLDAVTYGPQSTDRSEGRYPDGGPELRVFATPTPRAPNAPAGAAPRINEISLIDGQLFIDWAARPGRVYRVEYKDDLNQPEWIPIGGNLTSDGGSLSLSLNVSEQPLRFYRILQVQ